MAKRLKHLIVYFCVVLLFPLQQLTGINPLFDTSIAVSLETKERKNHRADAKRLKRNSIYLFRQGHAFDIHAIKVLAKSGQTAEAKVFLNLAKTYYFNALQHDKTNQLIKIFHDAHDTFTNGVVSPGSKEAKAILVRLYDPQDDEIERDYEVSLNDPDLSAYWQASKLSPYTAVETMEPKPENPEERVSTQTKWGSAISATTLVATAGFAIAQSLTDTVYLQYIGGASGGAVGFISYLIVYKIFSCCMNQHDAARNTEELNSLIAALDEKFGKTDDDDAGPAVSINLRKLTANGRAVATSGPVDDEDITSKRRQSSVLPQESDVLSSLDPKFRELYQTRLQKFGPQDEVVQEILKRNRQLQQTQTRRASMPQPTISIGHNSPQSEDDFDEDISVDDSPDTAPPAETTPVQKHHPKKKGKAKAGSDNPDDLPSAQDDDEEDTHYDGDEENV